jgi:hypothetical protein
MPRAGASEGTRSRPRRPDFAAAHVVRAADRRPPRASAGPVAGRASGAAVARQRAPRVQCRRIELVTTGWPGAASTNTPG